MWNGRPENVWMNVGDGSKQPVQNVVAQPKTPNSVPFGHVKGVEKSSQDERPVNNPVASIPPEMNNDARPGLKEEKKVPSSDPNHKEGQEKVEKGGSGSTGLQKAAGNVLRTITSKKSTMSARLYRGILSGVYLTEESIFSLSRYLLHVSEANLAVCLCLIFIFIYWYTTPSLLLMSPWSQSGLVWVTICVCFQLLWSLLNWCYATDMAHYQYWTGKYDNLVLIVGWLIVAVTNLLATIIIIYWNVTYQSDFEKYFLVRLDGCEKAGMRSYDEGVEDSVIDAYQDWGECCGFNGPMEWLMEKDYMLRRFTKRYSFQNTRGPLTCGRVSMLRNEVSEGSGWVCSVPISCIDPKQSAASPVLPALSTDGHQDWLTMFRQTPCKDAQLNWAPKVILVLSLIQFLLTGSGFILYRLISTAVTSVRRKAKLFGAQTMQYRKKDLEAKVKNYRELRRRIWNAVWDYKEGKPVFLFFAKHPFFGETDPINLKKRQKPKADAADPGGEGKGNKEKKSEHAKNKRLDEERKRKDRPVAEDEKKEVETKTFMERLAASNPARNEPERGRPEVRAPVFPTTGFTTPSAPEEQPWQNLQNQPYQPFKNQPAGQQYQPLQQNQPYQPLQNLSGEPQQIFQPPQPPEQQQANQQPEQKSKFQKWFPTWGS